MFCSCVDMYGNGNTSHASSNQLGSLEQPNSKVGSNKSMTTPFCKKFYLGNWICCLRAVAFGIHQDGISDDDAGP